MSPSTGTVIVIPPLTSSITRANAKNFAHRLSESTGIRWRLSKKLAIISLKNILNVSDGILIADRRLNDAPSNFVSFVIILILSTVANFSYFPPNFNGIAFHSTLPLTTLLLFFLCLFMLLFSLSHTHTHIRLLFPLFFGHSRLIIIQRWNNFNWRCTSEKNEICFDIYKHLIHGSWEFFFLNKFLVKSLTKK